MIEKRGNKWCVIHGHPKKTDSKTDKPKGAIIKCFNTETEAKRMHTAIILSQKGETKK